MNLTTATGREYKLEELPPDVQELVRIYSMWIEELKQAKIEVYKLEAAINRISVEIQVRIDKLEPQR